ncbi:helix-turn-helix domain-containing protein [Nonomuraea lactucae]|uniref:helix-turn-helix domain-containing protein n=1 Tax=Nonomuraea lactucae TaxID=2249762 RepID=UPI000DE1FAE2|nr:helix-turn-helix domain-containing protein [Nonomuraea lactucae]
MEEQSIGARLAAARSAAGMTVAQLSAVTRIREALIYAIERDDFSQCGGDFYERGHIKALAKAVGLDPEAMVHLYDEQHGGAPPPVRAAAVFQADRKIKLSERRGPNWTMALGVALAIVVVFGVARVMGGTPEKVRSAGVQQASAVPSAPAQGAARGKAASRVKGQVVVKVTADRAAYLNVRDAEGHRLFAGTLEAGKSSTWRAPKRINLLIGDGSAVSLQVNGKNLGRPGGSGEVVRRSFGPPKPQAR